MKRIKADEGSEKSFSKDEIYDLIVKTIINISSNSIEKIEYTDNLIDDLKLDSLDLITLVVDIESYFNIKIDEELLDDVETVQDCNEVIANFLKSKNMLKN